jgi:hypothetical protein
MKKRTQAEIRQRLEELVLYVAERCESHRLFGRTKLLKVLFNADFTSYERFGQPITGAAYRRFEHGPVPNEFPAARADLIQRGDAVEERIATSGPAETRLLPRRRCNLELFSERDIAIVDEVIALAENKGGVELSRESHDFVGWQLARPGQVIPYEAVFIGTEPPELSPDELAYADRIARGLP